LFHTATVHEIILPTADRNILVRIIMQQRNTGTKNSSHPFRSRNIAVADLGCSLEENVGYVAVIITIRTKAKDYSGPWC
jgi:hypothetical protein